MCRVVMLFGGGSRPCDSTSIMINECLRMFQECATKHNIVGVQVRDYDEIVMTVGSHGKLETSARSVQLVDQVASLGTATSRPEIERKPR